MNWYLLFGLPLFHFERFEVEGQIHSAGGHVKSKSDITFQEWSEVLGA